MHSGRALTIGLAMVGTVLIWSGVRSARNGHAAAAPGDGATVRFFRNPAAVASFSATDLDGKPLSSADWKGKVVIVNFWATWCPPCRAEIPDLIALQEKYRDTLQIVGVSEDEAPPEHVKRFAAERGINYPVVMTNTELQRIFPGIQALPTSFIVDREGRLVQKHVGMLSAQMTELETRALAGLPVNAAIEQVEQTQGLKLENGAQLMEIPGVDLAALSPSKRADALQKLNGQPCTCGCDLTVAKCRVDDPACGVSLPLARQIVKQIAEAR